MAAIYTKQEFSPRILSKRWLAMKFRPNMVLFSQDHIGSILSSGLLFREDCAEVEQEIPSSKQVWRLAGGRYAGFTKEEGVVSLIAVSLCVAVFPPRSFLRSNLLKLLLYASVPIVVRVSHRHAMLWPLRNLLDAMNKYLALARRAAACLKEYAALHNTIQSVASAIESTRMLLTRQQNELAMLMSRASSALLGNVPWLRGDVAWEAVEGVPQDNLMKIHHAFLVVQSTLLKHIAMAHSAPPAHALRVYKNYNERLYWIHNVLVIHLTGEFNEKLENLERMYRLLRNIGNNDSGAKKKLGSAVVDNWFYSDIHSGVSRASLELKLAASKCNDLDIFLDSCALNQQDVELNVLSKDIDEIIDAVTKCLSTVQNSQIRLKKLKGKIDGCEREFATNVNEVSDEEEIVHIDDKDPEVRDEVFYCVNTEDNEESRTVSDVTTAPGDKEREATKIVLCELKRKLGKREDMMRERERQALVKTMPELKDKVPDFPRQIKFEEFIEWKGYITKLSLHHTPKRRLFRSYEIKKSKSNKKYKSQIEKYVQVSDIVQPFYKANEKLHFKSRFISVSLVGHEIVITIWRKCIRSAEKNDKPKLLNPSEPSESVSDTESNANGPQQNGHGDLKFSKGELELSDSSSDSDFDGYKERKLALLKDVRRYRAARKKNYPDKRASIDKSIEKEDESLKPIEYSFGTGMAMASVLQVKAKFPSMAQEEVFIGDGEVSDDSGNDDDE